MVSMKLIAFVALLGLSMVNGQGCPCKYTNQLWGDVNPNVYYFCNPSSNTSVQMQCGEGYGFLKNTGASGCVPWSQWPSSCVNLVNSAPMCTSTNLNKPLPALNPNYYYLCLAAGQSPTLMSCVSGRGFISSGGYMGCAEWSQWRSINKCNDY